MIWLAARDGQGCQQGRAADDVLQAGAHAVQRADVARKQEEAHEGQQQTVIDAAEDIAVNQEQRQADQSEEGEIGQDVKNGEQAQQEEAHEGQQQTVIDAAEDIAVNQEQRQADQSEEGEIGQDVKNGEQAQDEQHTEEGYALAVGDLLGFGKADLQDAAFAAQSQRGDADQTDQCKGQNHAEELTGRQLIARVQEQILWVADRCDHTAEVCRDRLQDDDRDEQRALTDQTEYQNGEGDEGDERGPV